MVATEQTFLEFVLNSIRPDHGILIRVDGTINAYDLTPGSKSYDFNAMKDTIGCQYGEIVYLSKQVIMVLDEEGKLTGKQINRYATALFQERFGHIDPIVGDVVICHSRSIK